MKDADIVSVIAIVIIAVLLGLVVLSGILAVEADAAQDYPLKIWKQNENGPCTTLNVIDEDTGVQYVVVKVDDQGHGVSIAICPRYNADGSLYTSK